MFSVRLASGWCVWLGMRSDRVVVDDFPNPRYDLGAVELDRGHELVVGEAGDAELEVEAARPEQLEIGDDLVGDGLG